MLVYALVFFMETWKHTRQPKQQHTTAALTAQQQPLFLLQPHNSSHCLRPATCLLSHADVDSPKTSQSIDLLSGLTNTTVRYIEGPFFVGEIQQRGGKDGVQVHAAPATGLLLHADVGNGR